ncbi:hypothetical protein PFISCL1PPCAC_6279 [Pristionchus fissidentatus]|uniref:P-type domain-containing protein n=1 Tax=Pristionchus fissidentatus TaxID=1538716 RepID=A0AAV5V9R6_9BILA|nr:hypothetical protein PFISCL1PPCAC_6279 [Pristionchus fissidentatus]
MDRLRRGLVTCFLLISLSLLSFLIASMKPPVLLSALLCLFSVYAQDNIRIDCYPENGATQQGCEARGCTWKAAAAFDPVGTPYCFMKAEEMGYIATPTSDKQWTLTKNSGPKSPWGNDIASLKLSYKDIGDSVINVRIEDWNKRFEAGDHVDFPRKTEYSTEQLSVTVRNDSNPFSFAVNRKNGMTLFDTSIGGLIFADKFIQIATSLPSKNMYGWGEHIHQEIKHDFTRYTSWGMFARDEPPNSQGLDTKNLYGVHPFYMMMESNGHAHGVLILNANAQDVTTIPAPGYVYRTIGGILDIYFFPGPSPAEVIRQYTAFIGRPMLPAYWALGYQMCRYGYKSLQDMKDRVAAVRSYNIPFDVAYADIDYMERYKDFTTGKDAWGGFGDYVKQMHEWGMHNILIFDPAIQADYDSFQRGLNSGASFISWERPDEVMHSIQDLYPMAKNTQIMLVVVWPDRHVGFPDFLDPSNATQQWWIEEFKRYHDDVPFDGAWIDMNEPSSFGTNEDHPFFFDDPDHPNIDPLRCPTSGPDADYDVPPYQTHAVYHYGFGNTLATKTVCMRAVQGKGELRLYDTHNLYGWSESKTTQKAVYEATGKRGVVISRSTYPSSGRYAGHWLGDNTATWEDLRSAVVGAQEFNLFGIPYVGSDVCGFNGAASEEMCLRWQQLGSFHSFFRNHNSKDLPYQDPAVWPSVAAASKKANEFRYSMLPYLYSLHYAATLNGDTVIRPIFFDFPQDAETLGLSEQFMWGPSILVIPAVYESQTEVEGYIPLGETPTITYRFFSVYDYNYGQKVPLGRSLFPAPTSYNTPTFVKSGSIIPRAPPALTTVASRSLPFNLLIAPNEIDSSYNSQSAAGVLYWDDGDSVVEDINKNNYTFTQFEFSVTPKEGKVVLTMNVGPANAPSLPSLEYLEIFDFPSSPTYTSFILDGKLLSISSQKSKYSPITRISTIYFSTPINFSSAGKHTITWNCAVSMLESNRIEA